MRKRGKPRPKQGQLKLGGGHAVASRPINRLNISDIQFGAIDAAADFQFGDQANADRFFDTFYIPAGLHIDAFIRGEMFLVYGLKGTGKTSLLRYLSEIVKRQAHSQLKSDFFPFSQEFPREIYDDVRMTFLGDSYDLESRKGGMYRDIDYEDVWVFILLKRINELVSSHSRNQTELSPSLARFRSFLNGISPQETRNKLLRFLPNIKSGQVTLSDSIDPAIDIDFDDPSTRRMTFNRFVEQALRLYADAEFETDPLYILLDEIDPRTATGTLFELDCLLIRDLVVALWRINQVSRASRKKVYLVAAVRSEILTRVESLGKEIHKLFEQFGFCMNWGDMGKADLDHPLIRMICRKIAHSESKAGILSHDLGAVEEQIWPRYFRKNKTDQMDPRYFLDWTWLRPRDCIRIFDACAETDGEAKEISESLINRVQKRYSKRSWGEISMQLTLFMDPFCIPGLNKVLVGISREFTLEQFVDRLAMIAKLDTSAERLFQKYRPAEIISLLYNVGAIGNVHGAKLRFHYRGDDTMSITDGFYVHRALHPHFNIVRGRKPEKGALADSAT